MKNYNRPGCLILASLLVCAAIGAPSASAGKLTDRRERQLDRIDQGVQNGSLRRGEEHRLRHEQGKIRRTARRMRADDGKLGRRERSRLNRMQDRASRHIFRAKHNRRDKK